MEIQKFVKHFADQFDETDPSDITPSTKFKELEEWSSLTALAVIAMIDDEYSMKITGDNIKNADTVEDLFALVKAK